MRLVVSLLLLASVSIADDGQARFEKVLEELASDDIAVRERAVQTLLRMSRAKERLVNEALKRKLPHALLRTLYVAMNVPPLGCLCCVEIDWKGDGPGETKGLRHSILVAEEADFGQGFANLPEGRRPFSLVEVLGPERVRVGATRGISVVAEDGTAKAVVGALEIGAEPVRFRWTREGGGVDIVMSVSLDQESCLLPWDESRTEAPEVHVFDGEDAYVRFAADTWGRYSSPHPSPPCVDFERFRVVTMGWGVKPQTGYEVCLVSVDTSAAATRIEIATRDRQGLGDAETHPMLAVAIPRMGPIHVHVTGDRYGDGKLYHDFVETEADGVRVTVEPRR